MTIRSQCHRLREAVIIAWLGLGLAYIAINVAVAAVWYLMGWV